MRLFVCNVTVGGCARGQNEITPTAVSKRDDPARKEKERTEAMKYLAVGGPLKTAKLYSTSTTLQRLAALCACLELYGRADDIIPHTARAMRCKCVVRYEYCTANVQQCPERLMLYVQVSCRLCSVRVRRTMLFYPHGVTAVRTPVHYFTSTPAAVVLWQKRKSSLTWVMGTLRCGNILASSYEYCCEGIAIGRANCRRKAHYDTSTRINVLRMGWTTRQQTEQWTNPGRHRAMCCIFREDI